jgi:hypothetical protein
LSIYDLLCCIIYVLVWAAAVVFLVGLALFCVVQLCIDYPVFRYGLGGGVALGLLCMTLNGRAIIRKFMKETDNS